MTPPPPPEALLAELDRLTPQLRSQLRYLLGDPTRVDDVLQDVRLRVWSRPPAHVANPGGWLRVVAGNLARQVRREDTRRRRRERRAARSDRAPSVNSPLEHSELVARLAAAIEGLPEPERTLVVERYLEGLGAEALAARHAVSRATVDRRLARGRLLLRRRSDDTHPVRRGLLAWLPWGWGGRAEASTGAAVGGGVAMGLKTVVAVIAAAAVGYVSGWVVRGELDRESPAPSTERATQPAPEPRGPRLAPASASNSPAAERSPTRTAGPVPGGEPGPDPAPSGDEALSPEAWLALINEAASDNHAYAVIERLVTLGPDASRDVLLEIVNRIEPPSRTRHCLEPLCELGKEIHPYVAALTRELARNKSLETQTLALRSACDLAWRDLTDDIREFDAWCARHADRTVDQVVADGAREWVGRLGRAKGAVRGDLLEDRPARGALLVTRAGIPLLPTLRKAGLYDVVTRLWQDPSLSRDARSRALEWAVLLVEGQADARQTPLVRSLEAALREPAEQPGWMIHRAVRTLVKLGGDGVLDLVLGAFEGVSRTSDWWTLARGAADLRDPRAIPTLIAVIEAHGAYESIYGIGYFGLGKLTGVRYDESHDGAWWREWWQKNRRRFPTAVHLDIPRVRPIAR